jgi:hypothetical protein
VPGSSDDVTFDGASGGGTVTVNTTVNIVSLTWGAFTGTIDFSVNNNNVTIGSGTFSGTGSGARKFLMGRGSWIWNPGSSGANWNVVTTTNLDAGSVFTAPVTVNLVSATTGFFGGAKSWGAWTINGNNSGAHFSIEQGNGASNTFASLTVSAADLLLRGNATQTVTGAFTATGTSSNQILVQSDNYSGVYSSATLSVGTGSTATWCAFKSITGATNAITATNSFNVGNSTLGTLSITPPSGGGGGGRIIGG